MMTNVIVVANQKGGVGKTTTVVNMAHHFHKQQKKVLVIDFDGQGNASSSFNDSLDLGVPAYDFFHEDEFEIKEPETGLGLISADFHLNDIEEMDIDIITNPRTHIQKIHWADYIIIDSPPYIGRRLLGAIIAADFVLSPVDLSRFANDGVVQLIDTIEMIKTRFNPDLKFLGILVNKVNTRSISQKDVLADLFASLGHSVIPQIIANRAPIHDALDNGDPVSTIKTGAGRKAAQEFKNAFDYIETKMIELSKV